MITRIIRYLFGASLIAAFAAMAPGQLRAANLTTLYSFCSLTNCADGAQPVADLIADARDNLFGTTAAGGASNDGTVFEIAGSGFVPVASAPPSGTACNGVHDGTFNGNLTHASDLPHASRWP